MTAINFPDSPAVDDQFTAGGKVWTWEGTVWNASPDIDTVTQQVTSNIVGSAPSTLDTLNELAAALGDDENFAATVTTSLSLKQDKVGNVSNTEIGYLDGVTSAIQTQLDGKADETHTHVIADITDYDRADGVVFSATAPANPVQGLKWIDTTNMIEYVYYNSTWIEI